MNLIYTYNYRHAIPRLQLSDKQWIHAYNKTITTDGQTIDHHSRHNGYNQSDKQSTNAHSITNTINRQTIDHWKKKTIRLLKEETYVFSFKRAQPTARKL